MKLVSLWLTAALALSPALALAATKSTKSAGAKSAPATAAATASAASAKQKPILPFPMEVKHLPNGLTYIFVTFDSPGLAAYYSIVRTGSRNEVEPGRTGFAHLFEHMMFRGTEKYPKTAYDELLSKAGLSNNAFTTDDFTAFHSYGPSSKLPLVVELESDRFQNLKYSVDDFRTEARAVLGEYNKNFSNPLQKVEEVFQDTAFARHTYKHTTMGFKEDIEAMPEMYQYSLEFFRRWYTPDNTTLLVVGDFDHGKLDELIKKYYGGWKGQAANVQVPPEPKQAQGRAVNVRWDNPTQPRIMLGWHTPAARVQTKDAAIQNILGTYLYGPTSPTYQDLVLERQLVTGLGVAYYDHRDPAMFDLVATLKSDQGFAPVREAIAKAVADLRAGRVDAARLADVKSNQKYGLLNSFDNANSVAEQLVFAIAPTGDPNALNALFNNIDAVGPKDLVRFANDYLVDANATLVTLVGPGSQPPRGIPDYVPNPNRSANPQQTPPNPATTNPTPNAPAQKGGAQ